MDSGSGLYADEEARNKDCQDNNDDPTLYHRFFKVY